MMNDVKCRHCGGPLSRWGWYADPDEPVLFAVCIPCLIDDSIGFAAITVIPIESVNDVATLDS